MIVYILKVIHDSRIILKRKKCRKYYFLIGSSLKCRVPDVDRSLIRDRAPRPSRLGMRQEMRKEQ